MNIDHDRPTPGAPAATGENMKVEGRIVGVPFENFVIYVALSDRNEFLGIAEVSMKEDFRSLRQRLRGVGVHDVEEFYKDTD